MRSMDSQSINQSINQSIKQSKTKEPQASVQDYFTHFISQNKPQWHEVMKEKVWESSVYQSEVEM